MVYFGVQAGGRNPQYALITLGGDDGTRTHDPLLANTPDLDGGERLRTDSPDQKGFPDDGERQRTQADVRQMFDSMNLACVKVHSRERTGRGETKRPSRFREVRG